VDEEIQPGIIMQKEKIKIVCLIGQLGNGGSEKQLYLFLKYLDKDKFEPTIIVSSEVGGIWERRIREELGCKIILLAPPTLVLLKIIKFKYLLMKIKPDIVFSWSFHTNAFHFIDFGNHKFIGSLRTQISPARAELSHFHFRRSMSPDSFIVNSGLIANELTENGISGSKVNLIHNIFERNASGDPVSAISQRKADIREQYGILDDEILVAGVGRNSLDKDFPFFVETFAEACASEPKLKAILIGAGGPGVKEEISDLGLTGKFIITGEIPSAKDLLPCADIFFLSSIYEGMPNVLLEAIGARCATLSMDVGGVRDIIGEDNPFFREIVAVGHRDARETSKMLLRLANDRELRMKISEYNWNFRLMNFTHDRIMPKFYRLFEKVLSSELES
jgi:glycosyltransferase involved in cell wall biosynthesis